MKNIFPKEILDKTVEVHRFKHKTKSKIIYGIFILGIMITASVLPFVFMDIYTSVKGILKAQKNRNQITSLRAGRIMKTFLKENSSVRKGDTLIIINNAVGQEKINLITNQLSEITLFIHDLNILLHSNIKYKDSLKSFLYQNQFLQYDQKLLELKTRYNKMHRDFKRQKELFNKDVIARIDFENSKFALDLSFNELNHFKKQQINKWEADLIQKENRAQELESTIIQYKNENDNDFITSPIDGTVQNLKGLEAGNFIISGTVIAEISPKADLIVECYVSPSDIGLLKINNKVKLQIDAFNYNQWGMATGKILMINKDISIVNNTPLFKVICSLDQTHLSLNNGFKGSLKKGMTCNVRFFIASRSAFDLITDKIENWFTP